MGSVQLKSQSTNSSPTATAASWSYDSIEYDDDATATRLACGADTFELVDLGEGHSAGRDVEPRRERAVRAGREPRDRSLVHQGGCCTVGLTREVAFETPAYRTRNDRPPSLRNDRSVHSQQSPLVNRGLPSGVKAKPDERAAATNDTASWARLRQPIDALRCVTRLT